MKTAMTLLAVLLVLATAGIATSVPAAPVSRISYIYHSPRDGGKFVSAGTTIAIRAPQQMDPASVSPDAFQVVGSTSGVHSGEATIADDGRTIVFKPAATFAPGEQVHVQVESGPVAASGQALESLSFDFSISSKPYPYLQHTVDPVNSLALEPASQPVKTTAAQTRYHTLPDDYPVMSVTVQTGTVSEGDLFLSNFTFWPDVSQSKPYLLILDNNGEPIFARKMTEGQIMVDFKKQPENGLLTYWDRNDGLYHVLDSSYREVTTYQAANGYDIDFHEFLMLPNGHVLFMIYDNQTVDMSQIVEGGQKDANVKGLVLQELDASRNPVFEWSSWDYIPITDTYAPITGTQIDYMHGNAIEIEPDGNLLISSRHTSEVTKIDRKTGEIIWRLGGKGNMFTFLNEDRPFSYQHDIRRLPNGDITIFDNGNNLDPEYSRVVEYKLDETNLTATKVWEYRHQPKDTFSYAMGDARQLSNGNRLIGWGTGDPDVLEITPDDSQALQMHFLNGDVSYRVYRDTWHATPYWDPELVLEDSGSQTNLYFSWNGATDVSGYRVLAGWNEEPRLPITTVKKDGFENSLDVSDLLGRYCSFQVQALDLQGKPVRSSNIVTTDPVDCGNVAFLPFILERR